ncbi:MAG: GNAT family N-acetyltransferase [Bacteroidetes bacterium]|nr:GNAT family N-acetyltransferase [Bacteroidota bacterium]
MNITTLCEICERADAEAWAEMLNAVPDDQGRQFDVHLKRYGHAVVGVVGAFDVLAMNRVVGVTSHEGIASKDLDEIVEMYQTAHSRRFAVQVCPTAQSPQFVQNLKDREFVLFNHWSKLHRPAHREIPHPERPLQVERIGPDRADEFAAICVPAFAWPTPLKRWVAALVGRPGWHHYLAYEDGLAVATGALHVKDGIGWMGFAATDPGHRKHGAQTSLIAKRLHDAIDLGCKQIVVETAQDRPEQPNPSTHNLLRFGFEVAYERPNYVWVRMDKD